MKGVISLIVLAAVLMVGCQDDNSILEPSNDFSEETPLNKGRIIQPRLDDDGDRDLDDFFLDDSLGLGGTIKLLDDRDLDIYPDDEIIDISKYSEYDLEMTKLAKNYTIDGSRGGKIIQKYQWISVSNKDTLMLEAYLDIPQGAYEGELTFEIVFDPNLLSMELHPTPFYFDIPVILTMMYKGISENILIDPDNIDFKYYNPDGSFEEVNYHNTAWKPEKRSLMVFDAELHHFSRYGWTRKKEASKDDPSIYYKSTN